MHRQNKQTFWSKSIFSLDHKVIAKQFLFLGIFFLLFGGYLVIYYIRNPLLDQVLLAQMHIISSSQCMVL